jgi:hypothetical protein
MPFFMRGVDILSLAIKTNTDSDYAKENEYE